MGGLPWDGKFNALVDDGKIEEYHSAEMDAIALKVMEQLP